MFPVKVISNVKPCGMFAAERKYDIHTGLDLYCREGETVKCLDAGLVIDVFQFTGEAVGSPWWDDTSAVIVESGGLVFVYGELDPCVSIGQSVSVGSKLGNIISVLKEDKGITPTSMLHLEVWDKYYYIKNFTWEKGKTKPCGLCNPLLFLPTLWTDLWLIKTSMGYRLESSSGEYLRFFHMAADSKSFCQDKNLKYKYLTKDSPPELKLSYTIMTKKTLWFDEGINE